jgi:predicted kinase
VSRDCIIVDLDGTLFDCSHRLHHIVGGEKKDWKAFFAGIPDDPLVEPIANIIEAMYFYGHTIILASGRSEDCRYLTEEKLIKHDIDYEKLYMRASDDFRPDYVVKRELLDQMRADGYNPIIAIDDRQSIVDMWRENGIICLQCRDDKPLAPEKPGELAMMIGPAGAGKSFWLAGIALKEGLFPINVISSDDTRESLCGDFKNQSKNEQVFAAIHAVVKTRLWHGLDTIVDATNIRRKDRVALLNLRPPGGKAVYFVFNRPMEDKRRDGGWRNEVMKDGKPFDLIGKHEEVFNNNLKDILAGDHMPDVAVIDMRGKL